MFTFNPHSKHLLTILLVSSSSIAMAEPQTYGLYPTNLFVETTGQCESCNTPPQALWYFKQETILTPNEKFHNFDPKLRAQADIQRWVHHGQKESLPSLIWSGTRDQLNGTISADGKTILTNEGSQTFRLVDKIPSNLSYYNQASEHFFANQKVTLYGEKTPNDFVAHTLWPEAFNIQNGPAQPLTGSESLRNLVRTHEGNAQTPFQTRVLWKKNEQLQLNNKPVLAFVLNGAQGDDDEAHGGHFAVATGRFGQQGEWQHWLVNNFYNLGSVSEKGIIASSTPMYRYQAELNSGQSWYRPSSMLVAVLKEPRNAELYQNAINRVFAHFYRQDFAYRHAGVNCAGINVETLRSIGWNIPKAGPTNLLKAFAALPYKAIEDKSLDSGMKAFDYLAAEQTDLYPFVAFEAIGNDLLQRIAQGKTKSAFESELAEDLEALVYVHIPQLPSSRAFGQAPVASLDEYMSRVPADMSQWKIVPVGPRPFPDTLKDPRAPSEPFRPAVFGLAVWGTLLVTLAWVSRTWIKRRHVKRKGVSFR